MSWDEEENYEEFEDESEGFNPKDSLSYNYDDDDYSYDDEGNDDEFYEMD